jgi:hypothetical protein
VGGNDSDRVGVRGDRIENKMGVPQCGLEEHKKSVLGERGRVEKGGYSCFSKSILLFLRARAGSNNISLFFYY